MGIERRRCRSRNIGNGERKEGVLVFDCCFFYFMLFHDAQNGGGCFSSYITAGSDVSLGIDSWLDDMSSSWWPLLA